MHVNYVLAMVMEVMDVVIGLKAVVHVTAVMTMVMDMVIGLKL